MLQALTLSPVIPVGDDTLREGITPLGIRWDATVLSTVGGSKLGVARGRTERPFTLKANTFITVFTRTRVLAYPSHPIIRG